MKHQKKIAIYSGDIPSTTFIERLILGVSRSNHKLYVFGFLKKSIPVYQGSVAVVGYKNTKIHKAFHLLKYSVLLFIFKRQQKSKLDHILKARSRNALSDKVKYYPVLWHQPDIFHLQWAKGLEDWIWVKEFGMQLVLSLRGAHINYSPIADKDIATMYHNYFPKVDAFHAVSKAIAVEAEKYGAQKEKINVVYSGLDVVPKHVENIKTNDVFNILSVGRSHWVKGYTYALDACKILKTANFNFKYTIIGAAENIELAYQIHDLGLQHNVELLDYMSFSRVQESIYQSDILLLSSIKEGLANVVLEAMSLKTLVLSTDCGGMNEVITNGVNGYLTPIRDPETMAQHIIEIANLPEDIKEKVREQGLKRIQLNHTTSQMVNDMIALYDGL
ncbi:colanic acid/amylovoran biosynthesis glycosyltransferase [Formosa sp. Hel1_31_208]|uniref:glycosyltransferase family 4 protein n=1 Tax=Formosa sp. Hel1_31_208 TaxID=1798225 RepID=UPI00087DF0F4|nr:glycosyltransferase family 4 protein [Formosa sp. Hel1_31_208]SDS68695.1 colanic acid/amylovoran biosynthesis glycosyltransferase [Formosa sp. Hel1_31_208]